MKYWEYFIAMNYPEFLQLLKDHDEPGYADFSQKLSHSDYAVIGVRVPVLRQLIKAHYRDENLVLTDFALGHYLEVDFAYFAVGLLRARSEVEQLAFLRQNLHFARSWAITDMLTSYLKSATFSDFWPFFLATCADENVYVRRFAYVFALKFYRDQRVLQVLPYLQKNEDYMVCMGQAWLLATVAICEPQAVYQFLVDGADDALKQKTISKIKDSYRIDLPTKNKFVALRKLK